MVTKIYKKIENTETKTGQKQVESWFKKKVENWLKSGPNLTCVFQEQNCRNLQPQKLV